ncbi:hypothetical protein ACH4LK_22620 [Streptomyces lydicus]|uniref:hypothetical protein n=1 Tax=Streptomyces lydicus TaxID=47763 RepID=UPI00379F604F
MILQTCRRHPSAGRFMATCSGCAHDLYDTEQRNRAEAAHRARLRTVLGLRHLPTPRPELGETDARRCVWDIRELDALYARLGGTVTTRQVERDYGGGTFSTTEVTLAVPTPDGGTVEVFTDWEPAAEADTLDLPVIRALHPVPVTVEPTVQDVAREDRGYWNDRYDD